MTAGAETTAAQRVALVGAGLIGRAWAMVFARAGLHVAIWDAAAGVAEGALEAIHARLEPRVYKVVKLALEQLIARGSQQLACAEACLQAFADIIGNQDGQGGVVEHRSQQKLELARAILGQPTAVSLTWCGGRRYVLS